jgi:hypothetical protein
MQTWAFVFQSNPELKEVSKMYQELKSKGIEFPALDPDQASQVFIPPKVSIKFCNLPTSVSLHTACSLSHDLWIAKLQREGHILFIEMFLHHHIRNAVLNQISTVVQTLQGAVWLLNCVSVMK